MQASQLLAAASGSEVEAWGQEGERERILKGFSAVSGLAEAYQFREPVNLEVVQDYCTVVAFPTDLSTITKRLENGFYRYKQVRTCTQLVTRKALGLRVLANT